MYDRVGGGTVPKLILPRGTPAVDIKSAEQLFKILEIELEIKPVDGSAPAGP